MYKGVSKITIFNVAESLYLGKQPYTNTELDREQTTVEI